MVLLGGGDQCLVLLEVADVGMREPAADLLCDGLAALLTMLNSCASGVTVVNIDNGFGAAFAATRINRQTAS